MSRIGLLRPFGRDQKSGFALVSGDELLSGRIGALIASEGEVPWKPELDSGLSKLRNVKADPSLQAFARTFVQRVLRKREPDLIVDSVQASRGADGSVTVRVTAGEATATATV